MKLLIQRLLTVEYGLAIILSMILLGMSYPNGIILVYVAALFYFALLIIQKKLIFKIHSSRLLFYICVFAYLWGMVITNYRNIYRVNVDDVLNILTTMIIFCILNQFNEDSYKKFIKVARSISVTTMFVLSIIALYKYYLLTKGIYLNMYYFNGYYAFGTVLSSDNNMFSLAMFTGFILAVASFRSAKKGMMRMFYFCSTCSLTLTICFSGSRRAFIMMIFVYALLLMQFVRYTFFSKNSAVRLVKIVFVTVGAAIILYFTVRLSGSDFNMNNLINNPQIETTKQRFATIQNGQFSESFLPRSDRWHYAMEIISDVPIYQSLIGSGFDYVSMYVNKFPANVTEDYPHNPVLSALLYSGIIGAAFLIMLLFVTFFNLYKYRKFLGYDIAMAFVVSFFYIMISGNSIFAYKLFMFFMAIILAAPTMKTRKKEKFELIGFKHTQVGKVV